MKIIRFNLFLGVILATIINFSGCNQHGDTLASIALTPVNQCMAKKTTQQFVATATFSNGMQLQWSQVVLWSSSDPSVATVSNAPNLNGLVTSVSTGTTVITAYDTANNISGSATLVVTNPDPILTIFPTNPYMAVGTTYQLSAIALFSNPTSSQIITTFSTWGISPAGFATIVNTPEVNGNGVVTAGTVTGPAVIRAEYITSTGTTTLTVTSTPLASLTISPVNPPLSLSTSTLQFTAIGTFQDGTTTQDLNPKVTASWAWTSSNTDVATINYYTGIAQAVAAGTTTITAKDVITGASGNTTLTVQ